MKAKKIYNFNHCGATGRLGPSQDQVDSSYKGTSLEGMVFSVDGIQHVSLPPGKYYAEVAGARGGAQPDFNYGGRGAILGGDFVINKTTKMKIIVGQRGTDGPRDDDASGGGGSFLVKEIKKPNKILNSYELDFSKLTELPDSLAFATDKGGGGVKLVDGKLKIEGELDSQVKVKFTDIGIKKDMIIEATFSCEGTPSSGSDFGFSYRDATWNNASATFGYCVCYAPNSKILYFGRGSNGGSTGIWTTFKSDNNNNSISLNQDITLKVEVIGCSHTIYINGEKKWEINNFEINTPGEMALVITGKIDDLYCKKISVKELHVDNIYTAFDPTDGTYVEPLMIAGGGGGDAADGKGSDASKTEASAGYTPNTLLGSGGGNDGSMGGGGGGFFSDGKSNGNSVGGSGFLQGGKGGNGNRFPGGFGGGAGASDEVGAGGGGFTGGNAFDNKDNGPGGGGSYNACKNPVFIDFNSKGNGYIKLTMIAPDIKILIQDGEEIKTWNKENKEYESCGNYPATLDMFETCGMDEIPKEKTGLISNNPKILYSSFEEGEYTLTQYLIPEPLFIKTCGDINLVSPLQGFECEVKTIGTPVVKYCFSIDEGKTWVSHKDGEWCEIDISDYSNIIDKGMTKTEFESLDGLTLRELNENIHTIRFGVYVDLLDVRNSVELKHIKAKY